MRTLSAVNLEQDPSLAAIEAELAALEAETVTGTPTAEVIEPAEETVEEVIRDIAGDEARQEAYADQTSSTVLEPEATVTVPTVAKKAKKAKIAKTVGVARVRGNISDLPAGAFVLETSDADGDLDAHKAAVLATTPTAKKIAEKFENLFLALHAGKKPSTYVVDGFQALDSKGSINGPEMVAALSAHGYTIGTARSQAQQVMALFQTVKVTTKSEGRLTVNPDSVIALALRNMIAAA